MGSRVLTFEEITSEDFVIASDHYKLTSTMPQFELGGSVNTSISNELTTAFTSSFAKEMAKESSASPQNDSLYKSDFATSLLESASQLETLKTVENVSESGNIGETFSEDSNIYENVRQGLDSFDFGRPSKIFNSTMLADYQSSPRESLSSISRVQTVVAINGSSQESHSLNLSASNSFHFNNSFNSLNGELTVNYNRLKIELGSLQEKLDSMERSRLNSEVTNQQLMAVISKLSTQLSMARISKNNPTQRKQICDAPTSPRKQVINTIKESSTVRSSPSSASTSSSFRRQKAIRIKKRDSVRRNPSVLSQGKVDSQSYTSSDSGNYSDNNVDTVQPIRGQRSDRAANQTPAGFANDKDNENKEQLGKLLRKGLTLVGNVKQELNKVTSLSSHPRSATDTIESRMSSKISQSAGKVIIKIQTDGKNDCQSEAEKPATGYQNRNIESKIDSIVAIKTDNSGTVRVPVPYACTYYNV